MSPEELKEGALKTFYDEKAVKSLKKKERALDLFCAQAKEFSNVSLLEETLSAAAGDDYDGCFTDFGAFQYGVLKLELYDRLKDWFKNEK